MAPEKTDPAPAENEPSNENVVDTSTVSVDSAISELDHDPYFEPVVSLPVVQVKTNEEDEDLVVKLRCKLFRYHVDENEPPSWKERGTGDIKILKKIEKKVLKFHESLFDGYDGEEPEKEGEYVLLPVQDIKVRVVMRQDKTLKIRANHYITPFMELKPNCGSDRAWVWSVLVDFADEEPKKELFAVKFANAENAKIFKDSFNECKGLITNAQVKTDKIIENSSVVEGSKESQSTEEKEKEETNNSSEECTEVTKDLEALSVKETKEEVKSQ